MNLSRGFGMEWFVNRHPVNDSKRWRGSRFAKEYSELMFHDR